VPPFQRLSGWLKSRPGPVFQWTAARRAEMPATTAYERNDIEQIGEYALSSILATKKLIDAVVEARSDYDIFADISARLGKGDEFTQHYYSLTSSAYSGSQ
jgi:anaerobic selenocysteine-containing dehydrogenase